jgi:hypothetical protein
MNSESPNKTATNRPYGQALLVMPTKKVVLKGSTSDNTSAKPMENMDTVSKPKKMAYLSHFSRSCNHCGTGRCQRLSPSTRPTLNRASDSEPNGHIQPQNKPRPNRNTVRMMKIQNRKMKGSDKNSDQVQLKSSEWNQVSTWVIEGWAMAPKPTNPMLKPQALYLNTLTGHLFLWVDKRVRRSRNAYTTVTATSNTANRAIDTARDCHTRTHGAAASSTTGRPPCNRASASQYLESKLVKLRAPVARSTRLPRNASFHG